MKKTIAGLLLIAMLASMFAFSVSAQTRATDKFELLSVTAISDYQLELKFSEDLRTEDEGGTPWILNRIGKDVLAGLVLVSNEKDATTGYYVRKNEFTVAGTMALGRTTDTLTWTITDQSSSNSIPNILNTWPEAGYSVKFAFKDNNCGWHGEGYIGAIQAVKPSATVEKALSLPADYARPGAGTNEYMFMDITTTSRFELLSATAVNDYQLKLEFSQNLKTTVGADGQPWIVSQLNGSKARIGVALVSDEKINNGYYDVKYSADVKGTVSLGATNNILIWTVDNATANNVIGGLSDRWQQEGYSVKLYLYDQSQGWFAPNNVGYVCTVQNEQGEQLWIPEKYSNPAAGANEYMFMDITPADELELVSVETINEYSIKVTFNKGIVSDTAVNPHANLNANLRLLNPDDSWYYVNNADYGYSVGAQLQATSDPKVWTWTMPTEYAGIGSTDMNAGKIKEMNRSINYVLESWKDKTDAGYKAVFMLLDGADTLNLTNPATYPGYSKRVQSVDGGYLKTTHRTAAGNDYVFKNISAYVAAEPVDELELESVELINDYSLKITFNQAIETMGQGANLRLLSPDYTPYYVGGVDYGYNYGNSLTATDDPAVWIYTMPYQTAGIGQTVQINWSINDVLSTWADKVEAGYHAVLMIMDNGDAAFNPADPATHPGYVKRIVSEAGGYLKATHRTGTNDYVFETITPYTDDAPEIKSITVLNQNELKIEFTTAVAVKGKPHMALRLLDDSGNIVDGKVMYGDAVWYWADDSHTAIIWNAGVRNMLDFINLRGDWAAYQGRGTVKFIIEEWDAAGSGVFTPNNRVDQIYNPETGAYLMATNKGLNVYENAIHAIDGTDARPALTVESTTIISDNQIKVVFSDEISMTHTPWISLRIVNENGGFIDNARWQKRYATFRLTGNTMVFTFDADMMDMINLEGAYANIEGAVKTVLSFEELTVMSGDEVVFQTYGNAQIDNIAKADGVMLTANLTAAGKNYDGLILDLNNDERDALITVESAVKLNSIQIKLTFSAPVDIPHNPYIALRVYDEDGRLQRFTHDGKDIEAQVPFIWNYCDNSKTRITLTYPDNAMEDLLNLTGIFSYLNTGTNKTYLCIEELPVAGEFETPGNGLIDNIVGENSKLAANVINTTGYERLLIEIGDEYEDPTFYLKSAVQTGEKVITLTFSQPVTFDGNPYMGIRFVDDKNGLQYEDGQPLQYQGKWEYGNEEKTVLIWTATYGGGVSAIVNREGKFANYPNYKIMFCIEEIPADKEKGDVEDGTIHNIFTDGGVRLYANSIGRGKHYDGLYVPITVEYKAPAASEKPSGIFIEPKDEGDPIIPTAAGPASDKVTMAEHQDFQSMTHWFVLAATLVIFVTVIVLLAVVLSKKRDEE